jgi:hypothetical protein
MFETDLEEGLTERYFGWFRDKFFPVIIVKRPDYLIIEDRRISGNMLLPFSGACLILLVLAILLSSVVSSFLGFLLFVVFSTLILFFLTVVLSRFLRQTVAFYQGKDLYEIINHGLVRSHRETGNVSDIKEIKILLNYYRNGGERRLTSTSKLIPKDLILNDLRIQNLERSTINNNYRTTTKIVYAISDFLQIPYSEEEVESY